jgi:tetratricopeptide (TPR) repeat protein
MAPSSFSLNRCHLYAQKLNNSAALCIEIGQYDRAILSLTKALRLSREQSDESLLVTCSCQDCSLDGCIAYSESTRCPVVNANANVRCSSAYVYQRPIQIPPLPTLENHNMGRRLFFIVTFNLALAHHLGAMAANSSTTNSTSTSSTILRQKRPQTSTSNKIKKAIQLYELSRNWHSRIVSTTCNGHGHECECDAISSISFQMILSNNLSHIHRLGSNYTEHKQCLEHLLSTVMVAVEYKTRTNNSSSSSSNNNYGVLCTTNLEGFLMNASQLFLQEHCAEAA